jgi:hypothetical protein
LAQFIKATPYGHRDPDGRIGAPVDGACQIEAAIADNDDICYRYFPTRKRKSDTVAQDAEDARYVGGSRGAPVDLATLPSEKIDRR